MIKLSLILIFFIITLTNLHYIDASQHEDVRCKCVCPGNASLFEYAQIKILNSICLVILNYLRSNQTFIYPL